MKYARKVISLLLAMVMALSLTTGVWAGNDGGVSGKTLAETLGITDTNAANYVNQNFDIEVTPGNQKLLVLKNIGYWDDLFYETNSDKDTAQTILNGYTNYSSVLDTVTVPRGEDTNFATVIGMYRESLTYPVIRVNDNQQGPDTGDVTDLTGWANNTVNSDRSYLSSTYHNSSDAVTKAVNFFDGFFDYNKDTFKGNQATEDYYTVSLKHDANKEAAINAYDELPAASVVILNELNIRLLMRNEEGDSWLESFRFWRYMDMLAERGEFDPNNQSGGGNNQAPTGDKSPSELTNNEAKNYLESYVAYETNPYVQGVVSVTFKGTSFNQTDLYADATSCVNAINAYDVYMALSDDAKDALDELYVMDNSGNKCRFSAQMEALRQLADNGTGANNTSSSSSEFDEVNEALRDAGYTAPRLGVDFTVSFPAELVRGQDYDFTYSEDGVLTVTVKRGNKTHWLNAVGNSEYGDRLNCDINFPNNGNYTRLADANGNSGGSFWEQYINGTMPFYDVKSGMSSGAGNSIAAINFSGDTMSVASTSAYSDQRTLVVWDYGSGNGTLSENAVKYLLVFRIEIDKPFFYEEQDVTVPTAVETMRITVSDVDGNVWNVSTDTGEIKVQPKSADTVAGALSTQSGNNAKLGTVTVTAPTGYTLFADKCSVLRGNGGSNFPGTDGDDRATISIIALDGAAGTSKVKIVWKDSSNNTKVENLTINVVDKNVLDALEEQNIEVTTPKTSDVNTKPSSAATVTYGNDGIFYTTFNSNGDLPIFADMQKGVLLTPPADIADQVTHFSAVSQERETPTLDSTDIVELKNAFKSAREDEDVFPYSESDSSWNEERTLRYALTETQELLDGKVSVCYTFTQAYRFQIVQWLQAQSDGTFKLLGYSYVGGKSDSFVSKTVVQSVNKPEDAEDDTPFVVGDDMEFVCDRYPQQTENGYMQYFQFHVRGEGMNVQDSYTVYIPYSYFGMTKNQSLALRDRGETPKIYHYYDDHELRETINGEYTEYGVRFEVSDFSPFVVDCSAASNSGSTGGGGHCVTTAVKADSPATFDAGIALYGALAISSLTGMAYVGKKKF